jgi:hypothetical protein
MKKIIPMILLLSFSMPAMATEVKLRCTTVDGSNLSINYDEEAKTVNGWEPKAESVCTSDPGKCRRSNIADATIWIETYEGGKVKVHQEVDRMSGAYRHIEWNSDGTQQGVWTGTCVKFKQAF